MKTMSLAAKIKTHAIVYLLAICCTVVDDRFAFSQSSSTAIPAEITGFLKQYCQRCHGTENPKAGFSITGYTDQLSLLKARKKWDQLRVLVKQGEMPPESAKQPSAKERTDFEKSVQSVQSVFENADKNAKPDPGRVTARRLNRVVYNNTIRDLLWVDLKPAEDFPADDVGHGFDNIGDVLTLSQIANTYQNYKRFSTYLQEIKGVRSLFRAGNRCRLSDNSD